MNFETCVFTRELPSGAPGARRAGPPAFARRIADLAVIATIATAFIEVVMNPAAPFSAVHFWLALFVAAATRGGRYGDSCRN